MANINSKINKLILAFKQKNYIVSLNKKSVYSISFDKSFNVYEVSVESKERIITRSELKKQKRQYKEAQKKFKKHSYEWEDHQTIIDNINEELKMMSKSRVYEATSLLKILVYLADEYRKLR